jgi:energy-coupling factor transport system ATP-binding protein
VSPYARFRQLTYHYPRWGTFDKPALVSLNWELEAGVTLIEGDSGAGKSTVLRLLNGLVPHFHGGRIRGTADVLGRSVIDTPTRLLAREVGFVFQEPELSFVRHSVEREVAFGPENLGHTPRDIRREVGDAIAAVGLEGFERRALRTLSGGERQLVALASVLSCQPRILALDEPTSQLDQEHAEQFLRALRQLPAVPEAIVIAEHRRERVEGITSHRLVLAHGAQGTAHEESTWSSPLNSEFITPERGRELISLTNVAIGVDQRELLSGLDLAICSGDVIAITGSNGSGKTTLLRTLAGLATPRSGSISRAEGRHAYLPQDPGVLLHRSSLIEEVRKTLEWSGRSDDPLERLADFGLRSLGVRDPRDLSGGERQRAALATVLAGQPLLALLDEPTRGMDRRARYHLIDTIRHMAALGGAVVLTTHDETLADQIANRRLHIREGRLETPSSGVRT